MSRTPYVVGNWKMHKTIAEAEQFVQALLPRVAGVDGVDFGVCPSFLALQAVVDSARGSPLAVLAQTMHEDESGPSTGEVSVTMLSEVDVDGVLLGHSERREFSGETDRALRKKVPRALEAGLVPILCVGETGREYGRGLTEEVLRHQVQADLADVAPDRLGDVVIAYEPVWAIGTGDAATPEQAQQAAAFIRGLIGDVDAGAAERVRILYGGSVNKGNLADMIAGPDVDGALVGSASLDPANFAAMIEAARQT
jgi:triosephosphate isomerase